MRQAKIKRTYNIYKVKRHRRKFSARPLIAVLLVAAAALLVFVVWSVAGPIQQYLAGTLKPRRKPQAAVSSAVSAKAASSSKAVVSAAGAGFTAGSLKAIYLPEKFLSDTASLSDVAGRAKAAGVNMAVVNLKGEDGILQYASGVQAAKQNNLIAPGAPDAAAAAAKLKSDGITPCARICCFQDPAASDAMRQDAVLYNGNHGYRWLDGSNKSWLNPYNEDARQYLISIAKEAISKGYTYILFDGVEFPSSGSAGSTTYYGDNLSSKEDALKSFVAEAKQAINAAGGKLIVHVSADASVGRANALTAQDQNIFGLTGDYVSPDICAADFSDLVTIGPKSFPSPSSDISGFVTAAANLLKTNASGKIAAAVPYLQAFQNGGTSAGAAKDINAQLSAIKNAGISNFVLYNPDGNYDFSGVSFK